MNASVRMSTPRPGIVQWAMAIVISATGLYGSSDPIASAFVANRMYSLRTAAAAEIEATGDVWAANAELQDLKRRLARLIEIIKERKKSQPNAGARWETALRALPAEALVGPVHLIADGAVVEVEAPASRRDELTKVARHAAEYREVGSSEVRDAWPGRIMLRVVARPAEPATEQAQEEDE